MHQPHDESSVVADPLNRASTADSYHAQDETARASPQDDASSMDKPFCGNDSDPLDFGRALRHNLQLQKDANIKSRHLGVAFQDLEVIGMGTSTLYQPTIGTILNPVCAVENARAGRQAPLKTILTGFEGVVKPGEMLLVLGNPGSGCSTFLKTIANHRHDYHATNGTVSYDALTPAEIAKHYRGDVQFCPEDDIHFPSLTVEQTLDFAATVRTPHSRLQYSRAQIRDTLTNILTTIFGLREARKTPVGDAFIRGISGGQKKRVSLAETLAARGCLTAWDNPTRGLDASTALEFVRNLRTSTDSLELTTVASLYQAGEQLFDLFDKVCVIYEGRMAYFGPAREAKQYFLDMGYEPANRQTTADFLVAVTDPNARIPRAGIASQPRTAEEFAVAFKTSKHGKMNHAELEQYKTENVGNAGKKATYIESARAEFSPYTRNSSLYLLNIPQQISAVMIRRVQVMRGKMLLVSLNFFSYVFQAIIMGSVFLKAPEETTAFFSRGGIIFFAVLFCTLTAMAEIPSLFADRPIIRRHQLAGFYHPFIEAIALTLVDIPITVLTLLAFSAIVYFMVGLQTSAEQFFIFLLFLSVVSLTMKSWFRLIAAAFATQANAQTIGGLSIMTVAMYSGYTISKPTMIGALRWITYINPVRYGFESIITNEFRTLDGRCTNLVPQGPLYQNVTIANQVCPTVGALPGQPFVSGSRFMALTYGYSWSNAWMNLGIIIAYGAGFFIFLLLLTERNSGFIHHSTITLFLRGSKNRILTGTRRDEETGQSDQAAYNEKRRSKEAGKKPALKNEAIFSWQHINYTIPVPGGERRLLDDISGYVAPGKLTALMGESGAGKTTLLNVLASRTSVGVVSGDRFVNGHPLPHDFQSQSGYCQQVDTHVDLATVREALLFSAKLRQPVTVPLLEKEAWVDECLVMCGLESYADATIVSLDTEHKKRTTIAVELAAKPKLLLFLDEPTSGLDSRSAWAIVSFLRDLADQGQAILCTIHQPSAELFQVFDRLLLLRSGGQTVYFGDLGHNATTLINYFEKNNGRACRPGENPAEYILDVIGAGATAKSAQDWHHVWDAAPEARQLQSDLETIHNEGRKLSAAEAQSTGTFATGWFFQFKELVIRDARAHWRNPVYLMAKLMLNISCGLYIGFTFFKAKDTLQGTQNQAFGIFLATILAAPLGQQLMEPFITMRNIYEIRERPTRMYGWTALIASQMAVELPWSIIGSTLLFFTWYWPIGYLASRAGYTFFMIVVVFPFYYTTFGQATAAMSPSVEVGALIYTTLFSFVVTFEGILQPYQALGWWKWMYRLSPFTYLVEGLIGYAVGRQDVNCSPVEFVSLEPPSGLTCEQYMAPYLSMAGGYLSNPTATSACSLCAVRTSDDLIGRTFNIFYDHHWRNAGIVIGFSFFNIFLVFGLTYLFRIRTGSLLPSFGLRRQKK